MQPAVRGDAHVQGGRAAEPLLGLELLHQFLGVHFDRVRLQVPHFDISVNTASEQLQVRLWLGVLYDVKCIYHLKTVSVDYSLRKVVITTHTVFIRK